MNRIKTREAVEEENAEETAADAVRSGQKRAANVMKNTVRAASAKRRARSLKAFLEKAKESAAAAAAGAFVLLMALVCLIGCVLASPLGIFFAGENRDAGSVSVCAAVAQIQYDFGRQLEQLQDGDYDDVVFDGELADWPELLAVFAVKTAAPDAVTAEDVATLDARRVEKLKDVFKDANEITTRADVIEHENSDPEDEMDDSRTERILHICVSAKTGAELMEQYRFSDSQKRLYAELMKERAELENMIADTVLLDAEAQKIIRALPEDLSPERKAVVKAACSLVGKVNYFWGGKSSALGWDAQWGSIRKVTAAGSSTTGTYRPFGLDCSGFVDWVFYNAADGKQRFGHVSAASQHGRCTPISWETAQPGDLVFYPDDSHVGIVAGADERGGLLIVHCSGSRNNVVITGPDGFESVGTDESSLKKIRTACGQ